MNKLFKSLQLLVVAGVLASVPVAKVNADGARWWGGKDIVERLESDGRFTVLLTALEVAGLKETLASDGPFTLLAPTDDAFAALPAGTVEALVAAPDQLANVLLYHAMQGRETSYHLTSQNAVTTLQGNPVWVLWQNGDVLVNGQRVSKANVWASNGLIHVLEGVLIPPSEPVELNDVVDVLRFDGRFTTLLAALDAAGLTDTLAGLPAATVFAPTDDAFAALPAGTVEALLGDTDALTQILLYHVVGEKVGARKLLREGSAVTLQGQSVLAEVRDWKLYLNDSRVINFNVQAVNALVHVIDAVLLPESGDAEPAANLVEWLEQDGRFTTLLAAVEVAGLTDVLRDGGPFTLLAPTDEAFEKLPSGVVDYLIAQPEVLTKVLLYHVVDGENSLAELREERRVSTLQGGSVYVTAWWGGKTYINRSQVVEQDQAGGNGVVQVINQVLIPRW